MIYGLIPAVAINRRRCDVSEDTILLMIGRLMRKKNNQHIHIQKNLGLLSVTIVCSLVLGEIILQTLLPLERKRLIYSQTKDVFQHNEKHILYDRELGYVNAPNIEYVLHNKEYKKTIKINSQGFRDDETSLVEPDILLLGDSFAFGVGVEKNESFEYLLEDMLSCKVLNMGVSGYGTLQELISFRKWMDASHADSETSNPSIAIFMVFVGNDLADNLGYAGIRNRPFFQKFSEEYRLVPPIKEDFLRWIELNKKVKYPRICQFSYLAYLGIEGYRRISNFQKQWDVKNVDYSGKFEVFEKVVRKIRILAENRNVRLLFVYIPTQYFESGYDQKTFDRIKTALQKNSFELIDLRSFLQKDDYYKYDGHWLPSGHYKAAEAIKEYLISL